VRENLWLECYFAASVPAAVWRLEGDGHLLFAESHGLANVRLPWLNALSFRTHQSSAVLMSVDIGIGSNQRRPLVIQVGVCVNNPHQNKMMPVLGLLQFCFVGRHLLLL